MEGYDEHDYGNDQFYTGSTSSNCVQYRFLIPQAAAGAIISRKGETIKRLRAEFQCEISVPPSSGPERLLLINADIDKLTSILSSVFELVKDCMHAKINDPKEIASGTLPDPMITSDEIDLRFLVSENVCGAIIGKGGEVIRRLTESFRVTAIKVYQQMCPASTDRVIRLVGLPGDVLACLGAVHAVIAGLKDRKSQREYDPEDSNEAHAVNYGGWVSVEARRAMGRQGGPPPGIKGGATPSGRGQGAWVSGGGAMQGLSLAGMAERLRAQNIMAELGPGLAAAGACMPPPTGPLETSHVSLPNRLVGAIMGKAGSRINEIREQSGARIDVEKTPLQGDGEERVITIVGSREQIQSAQYLLQQCVKKYGGKQW